MPSAALMGQRVDQVTPQDAAIENNPVKSAATLKAFFRIMEFWGVTDVVASDLLCVSLATLRRMRERMNRGDETKLNKDQVTRISLMIGIMKALRIIHSKKLADKWVTLPNTNIIFDGRPPIEYAQREGILGLYEIRKLLDARRGMLA